jgi:hypothetical protein
MMSLGDAWDWYVKTKKQLMLFGRIGRKHWDNLPWDGPLGRDDKLKSLESAAIIKEAEFCLEHLDDFAILVLFSAFESAVREQVLSIIEGERDQLNRALIVQFLDEAARETKRGRVGRILRYFKNQEAGLVEEVNQVRRYRNWVAHGRRGEAPAAVDPATAYQRLSRFLARFAQPQPEDE